MSNRDHSQSTNPSGGDFDDWTLVSPPHTSSSSSTSSSLVNLGDVANSSLIDKSNTFSSNRQQAEDTRVIDQSNSDSSISNLDNIKNVLDSLSENLLKQSASRSTYSKSDNQYITDTDDMSSDIEDGDDEGDEDDNRTEISSADSIDSTNNSSYGGMDIPTDNENCEGDIDDFMQNVVHNKEGYQKVEASVQESSADSQNLDILSIGKQKLSNDPSRHKYRPINVKRIKFKPQNHRYHGLASKSRPKEHSANSIASRDPDTLRSYCTRTFVQIKDFIKVFLGLRPSSIHSFVVGLVFIVFFLFIPVLVNVFGMLGLVNIYDYQTTAFKNFKMNDPDSLIKQPTKADISFSRSQVSAIKELYDELVTCLQRQSPSFIKYYSSQINQRKNSNPRKSKKSSNTESSQLTDAVACYGRENYWKQRIEGLSLYHNLDLRTLMKQLRNRISDDLLVKYYSDTHPPLKLEILLNQIEYLDALEVRRNNKRLEDTVHQLQAENIELMQRLNQPRDEEYQQIMIGLEMRISKLQRENDAIKETLSKKAGTMYMEQLIELEQLDRENDQFKQFYNHVSKTVATALESMDTKANVVLDFLPLDEQIDNLGSKLKSVEDRVTLLTKNLNHILIENDELKETIVKLQWTLRTNQKNRTSLCQNSNTSKKFTSSARATSKPISTRDANHRNIQKNYQSFRAHHHPGSLILLNGSNFKILEDTISNYTSSQKQNLENSIDTSSIESAPLTELLTKSLSVINQVSSNDTQRHLKRTSRHYCFSNECHQGRIEKPTAKNCHGFRTNSISIGTKLEFLSNNTDEDVFKACDMYKTLSYQICSQVFKDNQTSKSKESAEGVSSSESHAIDNIKNNLYIISKDRQIGAGQLERRQFPNLKNLFQIDDKKNDDEDKLAKRKSTMKTKHKRIGSNALQLANLNYNEWSDIVHQSVDIVTEIVNENLIGIADKSLLGGPPVNTDALLEKFDILYQAMIQSKQEHDNEGAYIEHFMKSPSQTRHMKPKENSKKMGDLADDWYSKRAKQRKYLRRNNPSYQYVATLYPSLFDKPITNDNSDWIFKRAKTRERQRKTFVHYHNKKLHDDYNVKDPIELKHKSKKSKKSKKDYQALV